VCVFVGVWGCGCVGVWVLDVQDELRPKKGVPTDDRT